MAQMTVAAALSEAEPDRWEDHLTDTLGRSRFVRRSTSCSPLRACPSGYA